MKKFIVCLAASAAVIGGVLSGSLSANAATIDEVAAVARQYGYPEDVIQTGITMYYTEPEEYPPEKLDKAIEAIQNGCEELIQEYFPGFTMPSSGNGNTGQTVTTTTSSGNGSNSSTSTSNGNSSGTVIDRISEEEFINMTYEEKKAYMAGFSDEELAQFIASLSPAEYKSMMSQLPTDQKLNIVDSMAKAGDAMGMNLTVDEISDDKLSFSVRDDNGQLIGVAAAGIIVEDTGYDYRILFSVAGVLLVAAAGGLIFVVRRCFGKNKIGEENER